MLASCAACTAAVQQVMCMHRVAAPACTAGVPTACGPAAFWVGQQRHMHLPTLCMVFCWALW
jgi:hypothetical protein